MRILVTGANGQVGMELQREVVNFGLELVATDINTLDITDVAAVRAVLIRYSIEGVINAAAYTAVGRAESEVELATAINATGPGDLASLCAEAGVPLVHYSTDYVFDGTRDRAYRESDQPAPLGVYGATKLDGERAVQTAGASAAILRLSGVFSVHRQNFVKTMLRIGHKRGRVTVVADQTTKPTPARAAAHAGLHVLEALRHDPSKAGVYHFCGDHATTWANFAEAIFAAAAWNVPVEHIATADYPLPAKRPANSSLDTSRIGSVFGLSPPDWRADLQFVVNALKVAG